MVVVPVYTKPDDQYPLLMVAGGGDATVREPPPVVVDSMIWNSSTAPRRPWSERWPEYLSTCWMTIILLGISFLVFYAVGMVVIYRHESFILVKCNDTKPASEVFYHSIIPRGGAFPLANYAEYLSNMATLYPNLKFNIHFLIDDSKPAEIRIFDKIYPYSTLYDEYNAYNRREIRCFQKKHPNVNVTVMLLSKYMATTPFKYRWKYIPTPFIPFYARIFAVWLHGGIGLDIAAQNEQYHLSNNQRLDRKIKSILKQHNDGITPENYMDALKRVDETEYEYFSYIVESVQKFFIESLFNKTITSDPPIKNSSDSSMEASTPLVSETKSLIRTHRSKREAFVTNKDNSDNASATPAQMNIILANSSAVNATSGSIKQNVYKISAKEPDENLKNLIKMSVPKPEEVESVHFKISDGKSNGKTNIIKSQNKVHGSEKNKSDLPQIVLFYDLSVISEPVRLDTSITNAKNLTSPLNFVTIESDGTFIASTSLMHPFLETLYAGACRRLHPKIAIQNALLSRCPGTIHDENYCNNIFVF